MDENRLGFANPTNISEALIQADALESNDTWKVLRGVPNINTIDEFVTLYDYVIELSTCSVVGADYRALRTKTLSNEKISSSPTSQPTAENISSGSQKLNQKDRCKQVHSSTTEVDIIDPFERHDLANHWYILQSRAIEYGLKRNAESHQAAWLFCRLGVGSRAEFLKRKEIVRTKYNLSDKRIRVILAKIDKLVLSAFEKVVAAELYRQNVTPETEVRILRKKKTNTK